MSREDLDKQYQYANVELVHLGLDHRGKKCWFISTREGWEEAGENGKVLMLDADHFTVGTKIELTNAHGDINE